MRNSPDATLIQDLALTFIGVMIILKICLLSSCFIVFLCIAVLGKDYSVPNTSLVWERVQENPPQSATVKLKLIDDQIAEETESFACVIKLTRSENNKLQVTDPDTVTITLFDDDGKPSNVCWYIIFHLFQ